MAQNKTGRQSFVDELLFLENQSSSMLKLGQFWRPECLSVSDQKSSCCMIL